MNNLAPDNSVGTMLIVAGYRFALDAYLKIKTPHLVEALFFSEMVGDEVSGWNPFLTSLLHLAEQLEKLGIVYAGGEAVYVETVEVSHV